MAPPPSNRRSNKTSNTSSNGRVDKKKSRPQKAIEELNFDPDARDEYLTGFRKRKLQRRKHAQEQAAKMDKEEKVQARKEIREQRKVDLERHVAEVNALVKKSLHDSDDSDSSPSDTEEANNPKEGEGEEEEWNGIHSPPHPSINGTDEYVDEDKYTTVTIQAMDDAKAFTQDELEDEEERKAGEKKAEAAKKEREIKEALALKKKMRWNNTPDGKKPKVKKFRYESKGERKETRMKQKSKNAKAAKERKGK